MIAAACVALASCVKNEVAPVIEEKSPISFQAVQGLEGARATTDLATDQSFMATAMLHQNGENWEADKADAKPFFKDQLVSYDGSEWTTADEYYWPDQGSLTFFAYYPSDIKIAAGTDYLHGTLEESNTKYVFANYNDDTNFNKDFMVAQIVENVNYGETSYKVAVAFHHKMTKVTLNVKLQEAQANRTITLKKVEFSHLKNQATFTKNTNDILTSESWTGHAGDESYVVRDANLLLTEDFQSVIPEEKKHIFIPQDLADNAAMQITYEVKTNIGGVESIETVVVNNTFDTIHTSDCVWGKNQHVTYNVTIAKANKIIWAQPTIEDWDTTHVDNITI